MLDMHAVYIRTQNAAGLQILYYESYDVTPLYLSQYTVQARLLIEHHHYHKFVVYSHCDNTGIFSTF